jgi:hypothetical protein
MKIQFENFDDSVGHEIVIRDDCMLVGDVLVLSNGETPAMLDRGTNMWEVDDVDGQFPIMKMIAD